MATQTTMGVQAKTPFAPTVNPVLPNNQKSPLQTMAATAPKFDASGKMITKPMDTSTGQAVTSGIGGLLGSAWDIAKKGVSSVMNTPVQTKSTPVNSSIPTYTPPVGLPQYMQSTSATQPVAQSAQNNGLAQGGTPETKALQDQLVKEGYMTADQVATGPGIYGPKTTAAVAAKNAAESAKKASGSVGSTQNGQVTDTTKKDTTGGKFTGTLTYQSPSSTPTEVTQQGNAQPETQPADLSYQGLLQKAIDAQKASQQFNQAMAQGQADITKQAIPLQFVQGQQGALQRDYGVQQQALANQAELALKAAGMAAPVQVSPESTLVTPTTGKAQYGLGTGNAATGANTLAAATALRQNVAQGAQYQGQAADLSKTLNQFDTLAPQVTSFLDQSGINNSSSPWVNKAIKDYVGANMTPDNQATVNAMFADLKTYTAQILGNSGLNPTEVSSTVNSFDPSSLSPVQLQNFLTNIKNLGQTRLAPLQQASQSSYAGGTNPYMGAPATVGGAYQYGTPNTPTATAIGTGVGLLPSLVGGIQNFAAKIFK